MPMRNVLPGSTRAGGGGTPHFGRSPGTISAALEFRAVVQARLTVARCCLNRQNVEGGAEAAGFEPANPVRDDPFLRRLLSPMGAYLRSLPQHNGHAGATAPRGRCFSPDRTSRHPAALRQRRACCGSSASACRAPSPSPSSPAEARGSQSRRGCCRGSGP